MIAIDHIGVLARDVAASGRFLAEILGLAPGFPDGPDSEMFRLPIDKTGSLLYFPADNVPGLHIAFRVDEPTFDAVVDRLAGAWCSATTRKTRPNAGQRFPWRPRTRVLPRPKWPSLRGDRIELQVLGFDRTLRMRHGLIPCTTLLGLATFVGVEERALCREDPMPTPQAHTSTTRARVGEVLWWLPPDTQTIIVVEGPAKFREPVRWRPG